MTATTGQRPPSGIDLYLAALVDLGRLHVALSLWGQKATGLPIDCQVQSVTVGDTGPAHLIRPIGRVPGRLDGRSWPSTDHDEETRP